MDREQFIETQVAFQLGTCSPKQRNLAEFAKSEAGRRTSFFVFNPKGGAFLPPERGAALAVNSEGEWRFSQPPDRPAIVAGGKLDIQRRADLINDLRTCGIDSPFAADMRDAVRMASEFPVFQYNRLAGAENSILWPLKRVHALGAKSFVRAPDPSESPLSGKRQGLCWRGAVSGFTTHGGKRLNIRSAINGYKNKSLDRDAVVIKLQHMPRYRFMSRYSNEPGFDVGFSSRAQERKGWDEIPELSRYYRPYLDAAQQAEYKYVLSIQGTDVGSSFGWQLSTNCVVLREAYPWEVFFECHFRPWEHYVPVSPDYDDIPEKIAWCEANPAACEEMVVRRHELVRLLIDPEIRRTALRDVVARYEEFYARWAQG